MTLAKELFTSHHYSFIRLDVVVGAVDDVNNCVSWFGGCGIAAYANLYLDTMSEFAPIYFPHISHIGTAICEQLWTPLVDNL